MYWHSPAFAAVECWASYNLDIDISISFKGYVTDRAENLLCAWDIEHDDIDRQSGDTVDFLYDLIVNRKITPKEITDPQIISKYNQYLEWVAKITRLVEQGICPECGGRLDEAHGGGKDCFNCGWNCA